MKKMIVLAAAAIMASFANAASVQWGYAGYEYYDHNGEELLSGKAFLYLGAVGATDSAFDFGSATLLATAAFDDDNWVYGSLDNVDLAGLTSTASGQAYTLILTESAVESLVGYEGYYSMVAGISEEKSIPGATVQKYAEMVSFDPVTTDAYMANVPEPTSGLLLLLGMAGLALKRKNA